MKKLTLLLAVVFFAGVANICAQSNADIVNDFLKDLPSVNAERVSSANPVGSVNAAAQKAAVKTVELTKDNVKAALADARRYKFGIIVVGGHTFVRVNDFVKCSTSNAWGACMPYGSGYIKKGALVRSEGPINNIIGVPDGQVRTLYLFN